MTAVRCSRLKQMAALTIITLLALGFSAPNAQAEEPASATVERQLSGIMQRTESAQKSLESRASQISEKQAELSREMAQCGVGSIGRRAHCLARLQPTIAELSELSKAQAAEKVELMRLREEKKAVGERLEALMAAEAAAEKARSVASQASFFSDPADQSDAKAKFVPQVAAPQASTALQPSAEKKERPLVSSLAAQ